MSNSAPAPLDGSTDENGPQLLKPCIACGSLIPAGAPICATCKSYQASWRNTLNYIGGITGILTIIFSAIAFSSAQVISIIRTLTWFDKVTVSSMKYPGSMLVSNSGDGDVFVTTLEFYWQNERANTQHPINLQLKKGQITQHK